MEARIPAIRGPTELRLIIALSRPCPRRILGLAFGVLKRGLMRQICSLFRHNPDRWSGNPIWRAVVGRAFTLSTLLLICSISAADAHPRPRLCAWRGAAKRR